MWTYPEDCANKRETHSWLLPQMHHMTLSATYVFSSTNETQQKGYPTSCENSTGGFLQNGTPCVTEFKAPSFAIAGLCDNGTCMWPSTLEEEEKAHPEMYHHCPDRLNTAMYENPEEIGRCCKGECTKNTTCDYSWKLTT
nr:uncharacterized protein LOC129380649 isoform X4 [Dermacentor andersoni]